MAVHNIINTSSENQKPKLIKKVKLHVPISIKKWKQQDNMYLKDYERKLTLKHQISEKFQRSSNTRENNLC